MTIARLKITLEGIKPVVVERSLEVSSDIRLDRLHLVIQAAMGWENYHLYEFMAGETRWGLPDPDFGTDTLPVTKTSLADVIDAAGKNPIRYLYDFGDDWSHHIEATIIGDSTPGNLYPRLVDVTGRCPPEDVGGLPGYEHFLQAIGDQAHPEHEELTEWAGGPFDPNFPDAEERRLDVLKLAKKWKTRKK
jgi:hypothetical protein